MINIWVSNNNLTKISRFNDRIEIVGKIDSDFEWGRRWQISLEPNAIKFTKEGEFLSMLSLFQTQRMIF